MIYADKPRRYSRRGKKWSHVFSPDIPEMKAYANEHRLKRRDSRPFIHWDVTEEELALLPGITIVSRYEASALMRMHRTPRRKKDEGRMGTG